MSVIWIKLEEMLCFISLHKVGLWENNLKGNSPYNMFWFSIILLKISCSGYLINFIDLFMTYIYK